MDVDKAVINCLLVLPRAIQEPEAYDLKSYCNSISAYTIRQVYAFYILPFSLEGFIFKFGH